MPIISPLRSARGAPVPIRPARWLLSILLACIAGVAFGQNDAACRSTPGVQLAYASHRLEAGDMSAALEVIPREQILTGVDWQFFLNQANPSQSFMYPPGWRPAVVPVDPMAGDAGVRLDGPDGSAALEVFLDGASLFTARGPVTLGDVAGYALSRVLGGSSYQVLCSSSATSPTMASLGGATLFGAVATATHYAVVNVYSFSSPGTEPSLFYLVYAAPRENFDAYLRYVFAPVVDSFPKGGGGGCSCDLGEPDRDNDGTCDRCDDYPDDPNRQ